VEEVFFKISCPRSLQTNLGTEFQNAVLENTCRMLDIQKLLTTIHRPSANGRCGRIHKTISTCLAKIVSVSRTDWDEKQPLVAFGMNCAENDSTGYAPFELMYPRVPRMPVEMVLEVQANNFTRDLN